MNLLLTSAGRRSYLVDYFRAAWRGGGAVHAANSTRDAAALFHADHAVITPGICSAEYIPFLREYCREHRIGAVIPLLDMDLPALSEHREAFRAQGTRLVVASPETLRCCNDKLETARLLERLGLRFPQTFAGPAAAEEALACGRLQFPVVIKPRGGAGSLGVHVARDADEWRVFTRRVLREPSPGGLCGDSPGDGVLYQEFLAGVEYGMDVINDLDGNCAGTFARRKLAMRAGETDAACTVACPALEEIGRKLSRALRHPANLDVDLMERDGEFYVLELNARFGGGYPFSHLAGVNLPLALRHWLLGETPPAGCFHYRTGVTVFKTLHPEISPLHPPEPESGPEEGA